MRRIVYHGLYWVLFLLWASAFTDWHNFTVNCEQTFYLNVREVAIRIPLIIVSTYILIYKILPKYLFDRKSTLQFGFATFLLFIGVNLLNRTCSSYVLSGGLQSVDIFKANFFNLEPAIRHALIFVASFGLASMIRFYRIYIKNEELQHALIQDKLQTQLSFFKAQVSPHFLFNALNNIYSNCVRFGRNDIASSIDHLSGIMRYLTYDSNKEYVPLKKEVELLKDYIEVERERFSASEEVVISFVIDGNIDNQLIAPILFLPLVENIFKHGVSLVEDSYIIIKLTSDQDQIHFETRNKIFEKQHYLSGVGLQNVKKRLSLIYPDRHELLINDVNGEYILSLKIQL